MKHKLAIDFGTTNTVLARWNDKKDDSEIINLDGIGYKASDDLPHLVPSLVYINDGKSGAITCGQRVRVDGLNLKRDNRLFRNFKRGIVSSPAPEPRVIDDVSWADRDAGRVFIQKLIGVAPFAHDEIEQLVLTAPVASFEGYLAWLKNRGYIVRSRDITSLELSRV
jgi:molecular chaperone DnaK (HSP70)